VVIDPKKRITNAIGLSIIRHPIAPIVELIDVMAQMFDILLIA
jgi:hypothetical protein